jgi:hypothetical protein
MSSCNNVRSQDVCTKLQRSVERQFKAQGTGMTLPSSTSSATAQILKLALDEIIGRSDELRQTASTCTLGEKHLLQAIEQICPELHTRVEQVYAEAMNNLASGGGKGKDITMAFSGEIKEAAAIATSDKVGTQSNAPKPKPKSPKPKPKSPKPKPKSPKPKPKPKPKTSSSSSSRSPRTKSKSSSSPKPSPSRRSNRTRTNKTTRTN